MKTATVFTILILLFLLYSCRNIVKIQSIPASIENFDVSLSKMEYKYKYCESWMENMANPNQTTMTCLSYAPIGENEYFIFLNASIANSTNEKQEIDFNDFYLEDGSGREELYSILSPGLGSTFAGMQTNIAVNSSKTRILIFRYTKDKRPEYLHYKNDKIPIQYK